MNWLSSSGKSWDQTNYRNEWAKVVKAVPEARGMWLRDLRQTCRTVLTEAGVPEPAIKRFMGHSVSVSEHYARSVPMRCSGPLVSWISSVEKNAKKRTPKRLRR